MVINVTTYRIGSVISLGGQFAVDAFVADKVDQTAKHIATHIALVDDGTLM